MTHLERIVIDFLVAPARFWIALVFGLFGWRYEWHGQSFVNGVEVEDE